MRWLLVTRSVGGRHRGHLCREGGYASGPGARQPAKPVCFGHSRMGSGCAWSQQSC